MIHCKTHTGDDYISIRGKLSCYKCGKAKYFDEDEKPEKEEMVEDFEG